MKHRFIATLALAFCCSASWAQTPESTRANLLPLDDVETVHYRALDLQRIAEEDAFAETMGQPPRFAIAHDADISIDRAGTWERVGDMSVWRYRVTAESATSLNFGFTRFRLPEGAALYIIGHNGKQVLGPYTAADNEDHAQLWTPIIAATDVVIELNVPNELRNGVALELGKINQGYRGFGMGTVDGYAQPSLDIGGEGKACKNGNDRSGACNTDVACLEDDDLWNMPRRAVGGVSSGGSIFCTGSLVNNTAGDNRMLFATATHCGVNSGNAASLVVYWNYEWPSCRRPGAAGGTSVNPPNSAMTSSGATFLAATGNPFSGCSVPGNCSDFTLVEMDDAPDPAWNLYWAGWDRNTTGAACSNPADPASTDNLCASIHHPAGDEKRITFVDQNLTTANISGAQGVHWLARWDQTPTQLPKFPVGAALPPSVTEPGSSGSPLYTAEQRLVGVLSGGASFCGAGPTQLTDQYGKLAHAWDGLGTPTTRVRDYLDPLGTAPMTIDGMEGEPPGDSDLSITLVASPNPVDIGETVTFTIDVANDGPDAATQVEVALVLPADVDYDAGTGTGWTCAQAGGTVTCDLAGSLANGASAATLEVTAIVNAEETGTVNVAATVDSPNTDADPSNNAADVDLEITGEPPLPDCIFADGFEEGGDGSCGGVVNPDIVIVDDVNMVADQTTDGTSINWLTGETCACDDAPFNFNIWGATTMSFFWPTAPAGTNGGVSLDGGTTYAVLASGAEIGPTSQFITALATASTVNWRSASNVDGYVGFRFQNTDTGEINYGYARITTTGTTGHPATLVSYAYNSAGDPITIP